MRPPCLLEVMQLGILCCLSGLLMVSGCSIPQTQTDVGSIVTADATFFAPNLAILGGDYELLSEENNATESALSSIERFFLLRNTSIDKPHAILAKVVVARDGAAANTTFHGFQIGNYSHVTLAPNVTAVANVTLNAQGQYVSTLVFLGKNVVVSLQGIDSRYPQHDFVMDLGRLAAILVSA